MFFIHNSLPQEGKMYKKTYAYLRVYSYSNSAIIIFKTSPEIFAESLLDTLTLNMFSRVEALFGGDKVNI